MSRLLLISNSTLHGSGYLEHCAQEIRDFLGKTKRVLFVPYALHNRDAYADQAAAGFARLGFNLDSVHRASDPHLAVENAEAIFIGGGNTFRLLNLLYERDLLEPIRQRVQAGASYVGTSAGSNVACVSRVCSEPSAFMTYISLLPSLSEENSILLPSGDQAETPPIDSGNRMS